MRLWLVRHGSTDAAREGRFQGRLNYPLSSRGREEARLLALRLKGSGLERIFSSDLDRAWETARFLGAATGLKPVKMALLREVSWGFLEGLTPAEAKKLLPGGFWDGPGMLPTAACGGEPAELLLSRARLVLRFLMQRCPGKKIALVSHGRFLNALLAAALGVEGCRRWPFSPDPASLSLLIGDPARGRFRLALFNDCCHLKPLFTGEEGLG